MNEEVKMYQISHFSKITGLTVKALRYYDEQNMLKPSYRDKVTLYRYYSEEDFKKAQLIKFLRSLNFSITEIKDILDIVKSETDLAYVLKEKVLHIEENIQKEKALINKINNYLPPDITEIESQNYEISTEEIAPILVASIRFTGEYHEIGNYIPLLYKAVQSYSNGAIINCYYDEGCVEQADMELCLPTRKLISASNIDCKYLPAMKAICTTHLGSHDTLYMAYKSLFEYVNEHDLNILTPSREIYVKGPGMIFKGNPQNYVTRILLPYEFL